jgi:hypothetical protein
VVTGHRPVTRKAAPRPRRPWPARYHRPVLGRHFALDAAQVRALRRADTAQDYLDELEEADDERWCYDTDKAWDGIHRCLGDGTSNISDRPSMLERAVFGGEDLSDDEGNYSYLVAASMTPKVAAALAKMTRTEMRRRHRALADTDYERTPDDEDFSYIWENFVALRRFFARAARARRAVIFNVCG